MTRDTFAFPLQAITFRKEVPSPPFEGLSQDTAEIKLGGDGPAVL